MTADELDKWMQKAGMNKQARFEMFKRLVDDYRTKHVSAGYVRRAPNKSIALELDDLPPIDLDRTQVP